MNSTIRLVALFSYLLFSVGQSFADTVATPDGDNTLTLDLGTQRQTRPVGPVAVNFVDSMIVLAVDVSGSVDASEYEIQKAGIVDALRDPRLQEMLTQCNSRGIALSYVEWSGSRIGPRTNQVAPWTRLRTPQDMTNFANTIRGARRTSSGDTDIAGALGAVRTMFAQSPFQSDRKIVTLSGDGRQDFTSRGLTTEDTLRRSRDALANSGVIINSIAIDTSKEDASRNPSGRGIEATEKISLGDYFETNVRAGPGSNVTTVENYRAYAEAIKRQLSQVLNACVS